LADFKKPSSSSPVVRARGTLKLDQEVRPTLTILLLVAQILLAFLEIAVAIRELLKKKRKK
jgi:hypothetical protein